jgi:DNA-binding transcriptional ArsR family regulator
MDAYLVFKAIGDPVRIDILKFLSGGARAVGEIVAEFDLSQPAISHHLGILKNAQLVKIQKQGRSILYSINDGHIADTCCCFMDDCGIDPETAED